MKIRKRRLKRRSRIILQKFWYYSNALTIWKKFKPPDKKTNPTGMIWAIGLWFTAYGLLYQIHDNSKSKLENRSSIVMSLKLINKVGSTQRLLQVKEPQWYWPFFAFSKELNEDVVLPLKMLVVANKSQLDEVVSSRALAA